MLRRYLSRRGALPADADDLIQECAVRVLAHQPTFEDADDLVRWCLPVVRNLHVDAHRRDVRQVVTDDVPEQVQLRDVVQDSVLQRIELQSVLTAMHQLSPRDREAIVGDSGARPADRREAVKLNVRRHRARQRLAALIASVAGILGSLGRRGSGALAPAGSAVLAGFVVVAGVATGSAVLLPTTHDGTDTAVRVGHTQVASAFHPGLARATAGRSATRPRGEAEPSAARRVARSSAQQLVAAPTGDRVTVAHSTSRPVAGALVCVTGAPQAGQVCVTTTVTRSPVNAPRPHAPATPAD
jgi:RNA polymerase sigma factor (sigma-70 family)